MVSRPKLNSSPEQLPVSIAMIERRIYLIRDQKVMLDADLAGLYGVPTKQTRSNKSTLRQLTSFITLHGHKAGYLRAVAVI